MKRVHLCVASPQSFPLQPLQREGQIEYSEEWLKIFLAFLAYLSLKLKQIDSLEISINATVSVIYPRCQSNTLTSLDLSMSFLRSLPASRPLTEGYNIWCHRYRNGVR